MLAAPSPDAAGSLKRKAAALDETSSEHEGPDDEGDDEVVLPEALRPSRALHAEGGSGFHEAGIILHVEVENFMCHRKFDIRLDRKVHFITGQNGSGKSAIVAAIQLCLGAVARKTGRGDSLSRLIREGSRNPAIVRVTLLNQGVDAYKHEQYGDSITVERRIAKSGTAGYRLLAHDGKTVVSTEKRELERMLKSFNIFIDNPCCVLTQEESKKFIGGQEKEKYQFFLKATGLQRISEELDTIESVNQKTEDAQKLAKQKLRGKMAEVQRLRSELDELIALDRYDAEIALTMAKLFWIDVGIAKALVERSEKGLVDAKATRELQLKKQTDLEEKKAALGTVDSVREQQEGLAADLEAVLAEAAECQAKSSDAQRAVCVRESTVGKIKRNISECTTRIAGCNAQIKKINDDALRRAEAGERVLIERIEDTNRQIEYVERNLTEQQENKKSKQVERDALDSDTSRQEQRVRGLRDSIGQKRSRRTQMESRNQGSRVEAFGSKLPAILADMQRQRFRGTVLGPIGMHVSLSDRLEANIASVIVERFTGFHLRNFLCTEGADRGVIQDILRRHNAFREHNVILMPRKPRYEVQGIPDAITVLDLMQFDEDKPEVFNAMVDLAGVEKIVVADNETAVSRRFVERDRYGKENFRSGISKAVTIEEGTEVTFRNGNRMSEVSFDACRHLLSTDVSESINAISEELTAEEAALAREQTVLMDLRSRRDVADRAFHAFNPVLQRLSKELSALQRDKRQLDDQLEDARQLNDDDTSALEAEIEEIRATMLTQESLLREEASQLDEDRALESGLKKEKDVIERRRSVLRNRIREQESVVEKFLEQVTLIEKRIRDVRNEIARTDATILTGLAVMNDSIAAHTKQLELAEAETRKLIEGWDGKPLVIAITENTNSLNKKIANLKEKQEKEREKIGLSRRTKAGVSEELSAASAELQTMKSIFDAVREHLKASMANVEERRAAWDRQLRVLQKLVAKKFDVYMQKKGFAGTVKFDHEEKTLRLKTQTDSSGEHNQCNDVRQLSGGERSYTTLCLLLALGLAIECPFRVLDEYDVFLDQPSRKATLITLQEYALAKEQSGRQFIIVTPNDLRGMVRSHKVSHALLAPPERRFGSANAPAQMTLDETFH